MENYYQIKIIQLLLIMMINSDYVKSEIQLKCNINNQLNKFNTFKIC